MTRRERREGNCRTERGHFRPVIDRARCEAKDDCVRDCPYDVFEIRPLDAADRRALRFLARFKARMHGNRQAYAVRAEDCRACGICVEVCPFDALFWTPEYEYAETKMGEMLHDMDRLQDWMETVPDAPALESQ